MSTRDIPLDLRNPGQVFACLGFLEAADLLCGPAEGGFAWTAPGDPMARFTLRAEAEDPVAAVLRFLAEAEVSPVAPAGWRAPKLSPDVVRAPGSPTAEPSENALPIRIKGPDGLGVTLSHWADGTGRDDFKLYAGNRSAFSIAHTMLHGIVKGKKGKVHQRGVRHLWHEAPEALAADPFGPTVAMSGSFNLDARRSGSSLDTGYSPNTQDQKVYGAPVVEMLAAWGLENARPVIDGQDDEVFRYRVWQEMLPPILARPALARSLQGVPDRAFRGRRCKINKIGNKIVEFAREEIVR